MAYEFGLICRAALRSPREALDELRPLFGEAVVLDNVKIGDSWASCDVPVGRSRSMTVQANVSDQVVSRLVADAHVFGAITHPTDFNVAVSVTLVDDPDWELVRRFVRFLEANWAGVLFDEVSGFGASLD